MLYWLTSHFQSFLENSPFSFLRVFHKFLTFQAIAAVIFSFLTVMSAGPWMIGWLRRQKIGDHPNFDEAQMNELMTGKRGTPTMGGLLILTAIASAGLILADLSNFYVIMALVTLVWLGAVGAVDDWLKLTAARREKGSRQGLTGLEKLLFQIGLALVLCYFTWNYGHQVPAARGFYVPFLQTAVWEWNFYGYVLFGTLVIVGASNAVNLTDGLDGLAAGCMTLTACSFIVLSIIVGDIGLSSTLLFHHLPAAGQMAVFAGAILGACLGFLWFNCNPARVFMGDTGSLALGGLIGYIAIVIRQEVMLLIIGGIFAAEALSVMLQVGYFKYTRKRYGEGRRIFLMSPLHHHFQKKGWTETQVVVRFWIISAMLTTLALATIKLR
ncbi:MAG: phospho-N-acetylmuramoyl-pentapeptide-transferase [Phycisphaerae bacterium]|jgi:phospho-N-acetylmuramoyl-pentapeptide-transferase|nr:MAG: phospho-N-acetylmuramoyl-pentapeptide-transferase [Phycisphaerae bacterium]